MPPKPVKPIEPITIRPIGTATARAVPTRAGARPALLTVTLRLELQCGQPGLLPITVVLPAAERVPRSISPDDVVVNGRAVRSLSLIGHVVVLTLPRTSGINCYAIAPGLLTVQFLRRAGLGNPTEPATYRISIRRGSTSAVARLIIV